MLRMSFLIPQSELPGLLGPGALIEQCAAIEAGVPSRASRFHSGEVALMLIGLIELAQSDSWLRISALAAEGIWSAA